MAAPALTLQTPQAVFAELMSARRGDPIEETLARILASWMLGLGALPACLGLTEAAFLAMLRRHFPGADAISMLAIGESVDISRNDESEDLRKLLMANRSGRGESEVWMAEIVIAGCLGDDHLWQDLGLWTRADLSRLMRDNFAPLAKRNDKDMKWKKFLYKQLCETAGIYTCRAPSCRVCSDFQHCFGPEDA